MACVICDTEKKTVPLPKCGHITCRTCMLTWLETCRVNSLLETCPLCRAPVIEFHELIFKINKDTLTVKTDGMMEWAHHGVFQYKQRIGSLDKATDDVCAFLQATSDKSYTVYMGDPLREMYWEFAVVQKKDIKTILVFGARMHTRTQRQRDIFDVLLKNSPLMVYTRHNQRVSIKTAYETMMYE